MKQLIDAQKQAMHIITVALAGTNLIQLEAELKAKSKKELVAMLMNPSTCFERSKLLNHKISIEGICYDILCDPACVWLTYDSIAMLIQKMIPTAETSSKSLSWYASKGIEKERDVLPRMKIKDLTKLLLSM